MSINQSNSDDGTSQLCSSSLGILTKNFVDLICASESGELNLNFAAEKLKAQKRRLYDITNVLEGVRLLKKCSKNHVEWIGSTVDDGQNRSIEGLKKHLEFLRNENRSLEKEYNRLNDIRQRLDLEVQQTMGASDYYLTMKDLMKFKLTAPQETLLTVATPYNASIHIGSDEERTIRVENHIQTPSHSNQPLRVSLTQECCLFNEGSNNNLFNNKAS